MEEKKLFGKLREMVWLKLSSFSSPSSSFFYSSTTTSSSFFHSFFSTNCSSSVSSSCLPIVSSVFSSSSSDLHHSSDGHVQIFSVCSHLQNLKGAPSFWCPPSLSFHLAPSNFPPVFSNSCWFMLIQKMCSSPLAPPLKKTHKKRQKQGQGLILTFSTVLAHVSLIVTMVVQFVILLINGKIIVSQNNIVVLVFMMCQIFGFSGEEWQFGICESHFHTGRHKQAESDVWWRWWNSRCGFSWCQCSRFQGHV